MNGKPSHSGTGQAACETRYPELTTDPCLVYRKKVSTKSGNILVKKAKVIPLFWKL